MRTHRELEQELLRLKAERVRLEESLSIKGENVVTALLHPAPVIKSMVHELSADKDFRKDLLNLVIHFVTRYAGRMMDKSPVNGFADKFAEKLFGNIDSTSGIFGKLANLFNRK